MARRERSGELHQSLTAGLSLGALLSVDSCPNSAIGESGHVAARAERRSFWTWGYLSDEPSETRTPDRRRSGSPSDWGNWWNRRQCPTSLRSPCRPHASAYRRVLSPGCLPHTRNASRTPTGATAWSCSELCAAGSTTPRTPSPIRAAKTSWKRCSPGAIAKATSPFPTAAAPRWCGASTCRQLPPAPSPSTSTT